jgi:riboflavin kinase/FMN adenylyltransferase
MLGHWHRVEGPVLHGEKRGRTLGYPTANMSLGGLHLPRFGVYAVSVDVLDGPHRGRHAGAASIGVRPQFGGAVPNCETFLLDFAGDLYGATLSVALVDFLRPEMTFDGLPGLRRPDGCRRGPRQGDRPCLKASATASGRSP